MDVQAQLLKRLEECNERLLNRDGNSKNTETKKKNNKYSNKQNKVQISHVKKTDEKTDTDSGAICQPVVLNSSDSKSISKRCRKRRKKKEKILVAKLLQTENQRLTETNTNNQSKGIMLYGSKREICRGEDVYCSSENEEELKMSGDVNVTSTDDDDDDGGKTLLKCEKKNENTCDNSMKDGEQTKPKKIPEVIVYQSLKDKIIQQRMQRHQIYAEQRRLKEKNKTKKDSGKRRTGQNPVKKRMDLLELADTSKKKWQRFDSVDTGKKKKQKKTKIIDMNQMRMTIKKMAMQGSQTGKEKSQNKLDYLISHGARPLKQKKMDYKKYMVKRKSDAVKEKEKNNFDRAMGYKVRKKNRNWKRMDKNDIGVLDGQVGRFKHGVQFVKQRELKGVKVKK